MPAEATASVDGFAYLRTLMEECHGLALVLDTTLDGLTRKVVVAGGGFEFEVERDEFRAEVTIVGLSHANPLVYGHHVLQSEHGVGRVCVYPKDEFVESLVALLDVFDFVVEEPADVTKVLSTAVQKVCVNVDRRISLVELLSKNLSELNRILPRAF